MPTTVIVFEQTELQAIADAAFCKGEDVEKLEAEIHLPDNFYVGVFHKLFCGANAIPEVLVLKCRFASSMQDARLRRYLLFYLKDGEWVLNDPEGVVLNSEYVGEDPGFHTLQTFGLFERQH